MLPAVAAVTVIAMLALAGCSSGNSSSAGNGGGSGAKAGTQIDFWWFKNKPQEKVMDQLAAQFQTETGIKVNVHEDVAFADYYNHLVNAIAAGDAPDAVEFNSAQFGQLVASHALASLNDQVSSWSGQKDVIPTLWPGLESVDGKTKYAMPLNFLTFIMLYRKDLLAKAGVPVPKTQEELVSASKKLAATGHGQYGFMVRAGFNGQDNWTAFLVAGGARIVDNSGKVVLDSPEAKTANDLYISTYPYAPPGTIGTTSGLQLVQTLEAGTATMIIDNIGGARALTDPSKVGAALIPSASGDPSQTKYMGGLNMTGVLAGSKKKDAAFKWLSYLAEQKAQLAIAKSTAGYLPVVTSVAQDPQFKDDPFFQTSLTAAANGAIIWPALPGVAKAAQAWQPVFQGALLGKNSNDEVIKTVTAALQSS
jgi:multiple sugar transport system substrate-binding protein